MIPGVRRVTWRVILIAGWLGAACATSAPKQTPLMKEGGAVVSAEAMRTRMRALGPELMAAIEDAADAIRRSSTDPQVQRAAIAWKLDAVSELYWSLFSQYPMAGLLDAWAMLIQTQDLLSTQSARERLGAAGKKALDAVRKTEKRLVETFRWAEPDQDAGRVHAELARWAAAHPLEGSLGARRSLRGDLADRTVGEELSGLAAAAGVEEDLKGIIARLDFLPTLVPRQSIWAAELAYQDYGDPRVEQVLKRADTALARLDDVVRFLGGVGLGELAAGEREALMAAVDEQRVAFGALMTAERKELEAIVARERAMVLAELRKERIAATDDLRRLASMAGGETTRAAKEMADYVFVRAALLVAGAILLWGVVAFLVRRVRADRAPGKLGAE